MSEPIEDTGTWGIWPFSTGFMVGDGKDNPIAFAYGYEARKVKRLLNEYQSKVTALEARAQAAKAVIGDRNRLIGERDAERERADKAERALQEAQRTAQIRADYNLRCDDCHGSVFLDTVIPSPIWNAICRNGRNDGEMLCTLCIDARLAAAGIEGTQAEFYYAGDALVSKLYDAELATERERAAALVVALEDIAAPSGLSSHRDILMEIREMARTALAAHRLAHPAPN